jgi:hypothetical protein
VDATVDGLLYDARLTSEIVEKFKDEKDIPDLHVIRLLKATQLADLGNL